MSAEMDVEGLAQWLSDYNAFRGGLLAGPFDTFEPVGPLKLENRLRQAASLLRSQAEEIARLTRANRTRHDYDLTCSQCGKAHILDTSLPSEIWNQIAAPEDILCTLCIDERLAAKGLSCLAEFYFVGDALTSKLYSQDLQEANATLTRQLQEAVEALKAVVDLWYGPSSLTELGAAVKMGETARNALAALTERSKS